MTVIADITIPADSFVLGRLLSEFPDVAIELERIVPLEQDIIPLFWISGGDLDEIEGALGDHVHTNEVRRLTTTDDETLFEVHWTTDIDGVIQGLIEHHAKILEATGTAEEWEFRLRFPTHEDLSNFNVTLTEKDIPVTLRHLYNPKIPEEASPLSPDQEETLRHAFYEGYFEVPRRKNLVDLADEMAISDSALSQRIRRGVAAMIQQHLVADDER